MFASSCNPFKIGYLPDFPLLKTVGSAPDCFKERNKNYEIDIFLKIIKLLLRKSPWPAWGQIAPILAKVGSATDLGQPLLDFLNRPFQKLGEAGQPPKSTPHSKLDRGWPRSGALPTAPDLGQDGGNLAPCWPR